MMCDCVGSKAECAESIVKRGYLVVKRGCGADLDAGKATCGNNSNADFVISTGEGTSLYLRPLDGTQITPLNSSDGLYADEGIRMDGLGPGNDFWIRTAGGRVYSHVFTTDEVEPDSTEIKLWYVNRPR